MTSARPELAEWTALDAPELYAAIERPCTGTLWGVEYTFTPRLLPQKHGDGKQLVSLSPVNERPRFIVLAIDSTVDLSDDGHSDIEFRGMLFEVMDIVDHEFSLHDDDCDDPCDRDWPHASWDAGYSWSSYHGDPSTQTQRERDAVEALWPGDEPRPS